MKSCGGIIKTYSESVYNSAQKQLRDEEARRKKYEDESPKKHPITLMTIAGVEVEIDTEILPLVKWLNKQNGIKTQFSCQGEIIPDSRHQRPKIIFFCEEFKTIEKLAFLAREFISQKSVCPDLHCSYFHVELQIEWYIDRPRYVIVWQDLIAMKDFIDWLKLGDDK